MKNHRNLGIPAISPLSLACLLFLAMPAVHAAEEEEEAAELEAVKVTGTRITRQALEGATPVSVYDRVELDISGEISVSDFLRETTFNSFGSFRETSGSSAQSQSTLSLRGVGSGRTLVLVNGRRLPGSPVLGGAVQNLNTIPMAAVERIDILRDGASAIYGSDAVGGVVNIILRDDYEGMQVNVSHGDLSTSDADEVAYNIVGGITSDRGNVTWTIDHTARGLVYNRETAFVDEEKGLDTRIGISPYGYPGSYEVSGEVLVNPVTGETYEPGEGFTVFSPIAPDPRCPAELGDPTYPDSSVVELFTGNFVCSYNHPSLSASMASTKRTSLSVMTNYDINDAVEFFGRFTYSRHESFGVFAPAPAYFPDIMEADNPNYPDFAPDTITWYADPETGEPTSATTEGAIEQTLTGDFPLSLYLRTVPLGTRDGDVRDYQLDVVAGVRGFANLLGGMDWEIGAQHNRFEIDEFGSGYGLNSVLYEVIGDGSLDPFGELDPEVLAAVLHTTAKKAQMLYKGFDGQASLDLFSMPYGTVAAAFGFEYADESYFEDYDAQSSAGNVFGSAGNDTGGGRTRSAVFAEVLVPLLPTLEANLAVRRDEYSDFGSTTNPKLSFRWAPTDAWLFRASYGESFIAPDLGTLYAATSFSAESLIDRVGCEADGGTGPRCGSQQYDTYFYGAATVGANLQPETAENFTLGAVWSPSSTFSAGLDYYDITLDNVIVQDAQALLDAEFEGRPLPTGAAVVRQNGRIIRIDAPPINGKGFETSGIDLDIQKRFELGGLGMLRTSLQWSHILKYDQQLLEGAGVEDQLDLAGQPSDRGVLSLTWLIGAFTTSLQYNILPSTTAGVSGDWENAAAGDPNAQERIARDVDAWNTLDLQISYATPWNGKLSIGARNVTAEDPPLDETFGYPYYDNELYNPFGRVTYARYTQDF
ncbi:MAG TPA: TonB-dependent receptor [Gammaproteobacteria bacterium]